MLEIMLKIISTKPFTPNTTFDACYERGVIEFLYKGKKIASTEVKDLDNVFKRRKKLKAVVKSAKDCELDVQIIRFADLHGHSGNSLLDGAVHIKDKVKKTEYAGALTDHGVMYGILEFYNKMRKAGKKPILGFEAYSESINGKKDANHLVLLAKDITGYKNLVKLTSKSYSNFYYKPQVSYDMLKEHSEGIIATSACLGGEISQLILNKKYEEAKKVAIELSNIFGKDDFYIEIQRHQLNEEEVVNPQLIKLSKELGLKLVATTDSHYLNKEDSKEHEIVLCLGTGTTMDDEKRMKFSGTGYHIHTPEEMEELFSDLPEALDNTLEIAEKCNVVLENKIYMPHFDVPAPFNGEAEYFAHLCWEGFKERFEGTEHFTSVEYKERLQFEIDTIKQMGFPGYFLIVNDYVMFAKNRGILVGPGRGSACGSLVAYCLNITDMNPIPYGLLFERFLNPDRISMPDIDIDFEDIRREEVIDYIKQKYGEKAVSRIITFGTLSARAVIRDVTRVLNKPYSLGDRIAKSIPKTPKITLTKALEESVEFKTMYENEQEVKQIVQIALKLEGLPRNISQHACGIIISPSDVDDYIPQILVENEDTGIKEATTQYVMAECEEAGLLKMDFLGLRTMGVFGRALKDINVKRLKEGKSKIELMNIPINDIRTFEYIAKGNTEGIFQLESAGMTSFMKELFQDVQNKGYEILREELGENFDSKLLTNRDKFFEDDLLKLGEKGKKLIKKFNSFGGQLFERLIAGISLYRPGPIDEIPNYINNMINPGYIQYETPELKPLLENTYGIIVYQEQCMFIVRELAGFTKGMADNVRKAMAKKKEDMLEDLGKKFIYGEADKDGNVKIDGCLRRGIKKEIAESIWDKMKKFGLYAFNKSHAGGYADIGIRTAWLAYYYPVEYMTATLNSFITKSDKIKLYMAVCKRKNIEILPPDVNNSQEMFGVDENAIRFGLMGIKNMGKIAKDIISERNERGNFDDFQDFAVRMAVNYKVNKKILEALVYSGAVDNFEGTRRAKLSVLDKILSSASAERKDAMSGQMNLFSMYEDLADYKKVEIPEMDEFAKNFKLEKEKEFAGFYVTEHPLDDYLKYLEKEGVYEIGFLKNDEEESEEEQISTISYDGENVKIAGIIRDLKLYYTKKDQKPMYVFNVEDKTGEMKAVIFNKMIEANQDKLVEGKIVIVQGKIKEDDFGTQIIVENIFDIESIAKSERPKSVWVKAVSKEQFDELNSLIINNEGKLPVFIRYNDKSFKSTKLVNLNYSTFSKLQQLFGKNVKVVYEQ
ncbi:MAG: hypothetical protein K0R54_101 [Clostridiaceae bacterium]|jgi:DNA polymerase-3 subunit alpha|nr:hypothetical protein [Clostridiaceae bacterium]